MLTLSLDQMGLTLFLAIVDDLMVMGGDMVIFVVSICNVRYYDSHYHAYVVDVTSQRSLFRDIIDHNVYHSHKLTDGKTYISLKYYLVT